MHVPFISILLTGTWTFAGLRDPVDFFPASLAAIISYFSAEVTRGIWKPVQINGKDWPSPAAILPSFESEIKAILAAAGVDVRSYSTGRLHLFIYIYIYCYKWM